MNGYTGNDCSDNIDNCYPGPCQNGGYCNNGYCTVKLDTLDKAAKFMIHAIRYNVITRDIALVKTAFAWMDTLGTTVGTRVTILFY